MSVESPQRPRRPPQQQIDPKYMTFVEHLAELRRRLIISMLAVGLGSVAGWFLAPHVVLLLVEPLKTYMHVHGIVVPTVYGAFTLQLKVAIIIGFVLALPVTIYQIW